MHNFQKQITKLGGYAIDKFRLEDAKIETSKQDYYRDNNNLIIAKYQINFDIIFDSTNIAYRENRNFEAFYGVNSLYCMLVEYIKMCQVNELNLENNNFIREAFYKLRTLQIKNSFDVYSIWILFKELRTSSLLKKT